MMIRKYDHYFELRSPDSILHIELFSIKTLFSRSVFYSVELTPDKILRSTLVFLSRLPVKEVTFSIPNELTVPNNPLMSLLARAIRRGEFWGTKNPQTHHI